MPKADVPSVMSGTVTADRGIAAIFAVMRPGHRYEPYVLARKLGTTTQETSALLALLVSRGSLGTCRESRKSGGKSRTCYFLNPRKRNGQTFTVKPQPAAFSLRTGGSVGADAHRDPNARIDARSIRVLRLMESGSPHVASELARDLGVSTAGMVRLLQSLVNSGQIECVEGGGSRSAPRRYRLKATREAAPMVARAPAEHVGHVAPSAFEVEYACTLRRLRLLSEASRKAAPLPPARSSLCR